MERLPPFSAGNLEAICKVLADTTDGLTGTQLQNILAQCKVKDIDLEAICQKRGVSIARAGRDPQPPAAGILAELRMAS